MKTGNLEMSRNSSVRYLTFGTNMQQRATVALRLTLKHMVMIL